MPKRNAEPLQVTIVELGQKVEIDVIRDEDLDAFPEPQLFQPAAKIRANRPSRHISCQAYYRRIARSIDARATTASD